MATVSPFPEEIRMADPHHPFGQLLHVGGLFPGLFPGLAVRADLTPARTECGIGAGSRSFGPGTVRDVLLSEPLAEIGVELALMDIVEEHLRDSEQYARFAAEKLGHLAKISATTDLDTALARADFVVKVIEVDRYLYWSQDFHIPRRYGFRQVYGENGGPGGLFHALRNMGPTVEIARAMERLCPDALLLNYTNPEHKLCEAVSRLTDIQTVGLCHGVFMGREQIASLNFAMEPTWN